MLEQNYALLLLNVEFYSNDTPRSVTFYLQFGIMLVHHKKDSDTGVKDGRILTYTPYMYGINGI